MARAALRGVTIGAGFHADLESAGIERETPGQQTGPVPPRTSFGAVLARSEVNIRSAMELWRHTDIRPTTKTYTHARSLYAYGAVRGLLRIGEPREVERLKAAGINSAAYAKAYPKNVPQGGKTGRKPIENRKGGATLPPSNCLEVNRHPAILKVTRPRHQNGKGGIRTPGTIEIVHWFSKPAPSAARTPFRPLAIASVPDPSAWRQIRPPGTKKGRHEKSARTGSQGSARSGGNTPPPAAGRWNKAP